MTVRIPIEADGAPVAKVFTEIRSLLERAGQAGRDFGKIDLSHPELSEHAEELKKVLDRYNELLKVWRQLGTRIRATGQGNAAPWDLDLGRMYPTQGQATRARETLGRRLLEGTGWGAQLPPRPPPGGGGGEVPGGGAPGGGLPGVPPLAGAALKFALGLAGIGGIASMARSGVGQAQRESMALDPLYRMLAGTSESFKELRDRTREATSGLGLTYEKSAELGTAFARLSGDTSAFDMARGVRAGAGLARGLGLDPSAGVAFMGRARLTGAYGGGEEKRFAATIAAAVREGDMQSMPEKVIQSVERLTDALTRRGVSAGGQVADMLAVSARMNASGNPALRGEYGQSVLDQFSRGIQSPGMGEAGQFFMYRAFGVKDPFEFDYLREGGPFQRLPDGRLAIEKLMVQLRQDYQDPRKRQSAASKVLGVSMHQYEALDEQYGGLFERGLSLSEADRAKVLEQYGGNQGADTATLLANIHNAITDAGDDLLTPLNAIRNAISFIAGKQGYPGATLAGDTMSPDALRDQTAAVEGEIERAGQANSAAFRKGLAGRLVPGAIRDASRATGVPERLLYRAIQRESGGDYGAVSSAGAQGLMQLMPDTARRFGVHDPFDVNQNVMGGAKYLAWLKNKYGSWFDTFGAYHAGEGNWDNYLAGRPSGVGPKTLQYAREMSATLRIDVHHKDAAGRTTRREQYTAPLGVPEPAGAAAVSVQ